MMKVMKQTNNPNNVYPISQNAKLVLLERLKQEISSKVVIVDVAKKRKRTSASASVGGGGEKIMTSDACTADGNLDASLPSKSITQSVVRSRLIVGINQCTRILEKEYEHQLHRQQVQQHLLEEKCTATTTTTTTTTTNTTSMKAHCTKPSLLILSKDSLRPPSSILDHITIYSRHLNIPTLVLSGRASLELGEALGMKCAAVVLILSSSSSSSSSIKEGLSGGNDSNNDDVDEMNRKQKQEWREWRETNQDIDSFVSFAIHKIPKL